jgi:ABC-type glycerol-3-phosphate transport system substrate-binding protein
MAATAVGMEQTDVTQRLTRSLTRRAFGRSGAATAAGAGALALAACGGDAAPAASTAKPVTVTYMSNLAETHPEGAARLKVLTEFNATNQDKITVDLASGRDATAVDKYKALAAGGTPPDVIFTAYTDAADMYALGMLTDVDTELKSDRDWTKQRADIYPAMLESSSWRGKLASVPIYTNNVAMIYNKALLQQNGVAAPKELWTWDDFKAAAAKFVRPQLQVLSMNWVFWANWLRTTGSSPVSADAKKITVDTPEMLQVMELIQGFIRSGVAPADGKTETYRDAKNDVVFEIQGPYRIPTFRQNSAPDFGVIHMPVHPQKKQIVTNNGGHNMSVFKELPVERRTAAARVVKWMNDTHAQAQICIQATSLPVSKAALAAKELQDYLKTDPQLKGFVDLAPYGWRWPALPSLPKITAALNASVTRILRNEIGAKDGLAGAQREAQLLLDEDVKRMS